MKNLRFFVSHSSFEKTLAERITKDLEAFGFDVWLYEVEMIGGDEITPKIKNEIRVSDFFLVVLSKHSVASSWVAMEIDNALKYKSQKRKHKMNIIPIVSDPCHIPNSLVHLKYIYFSENYNDGISKLIQSVENSRPDIWLYKETYNFACDSLKRQFQKNRNYSSLAIDNSLVFFSTNDYAVISSDKIKIEVPEWVGEINSENLRNPTSEQLKSVIPSYYGEVSDYLRERVAKDMQGKFNCKVGLIKIEIPAKRLGQPFLVLTVIPLSYWVVQEFNRRIISDPNDKKLQKFKVEHQEKLAKNSANILFECPSALYVELVIVAADNMVCVVNKNPKLSVYADARRGKLTCTIEEGAEWNEHVSIKDKTLDIKSIVAKCLFCELDIKEEFIEDVKLSALALEFPNLNTGIIGFCKISLDSESIRSNFANSPDFVWDPQFTHITKIEKEFFKKKADDRNWHPTARLRLHLLKEYINCEMKGS